MLFIKVQKEIFDIFSQNIGILIIDLRKAD